ncbi:MAG TPA: hypothetical protein VGS11_04915 [Candidatus Bathyarchaeia archaeon]|nr:hypothetical protein [Candidatus Bathyarchaeia archaeon]
MPKWKKDATEFTVGVNYDEKRGAQSSIPKPVIDVLEKPERITFKLKGRRIEVEASG